MASEKHFFTTQLLEWHHNANERSLPWKNEKNPYKIWLSEVILQQTRAQQGLSYYLAFTESFPTVQELAAANDETVFRLWQGLGYYNRCKNMLATARYIARELNGEFPNEYEQILQLKGIGPYTAAAISSFAFGLPHAVVDGNVYRALSRYFGIMQPFDTTEGKKHFAALATELLDVSDSAGYNQAIMDLGATVCTPKPVCSDCPLRKKCVAYRDSLIKLLPIRSKTVTVRERYFHYLWLQFEDTVWIHKRTENDIWASLHEPLLVENDTPLEIEQMKHHGALKGYNFDLESIKYVGKSKQKLTHQVIHTRFFRISLLTQPMIEIPGGRWADSAELKKTAFPKTLVSFLENNLYF